MIYKFNNEEYDDLRDYLKALKASDNRYNSYKPWTDKEDAELIELSESMSVAQLADHFKRIKGGIRARLSKHAMNNIDIPPESNKFFDAIIKGVDPFTGEFLEDDSVWKHPKIVSDIKKYLEDKKKSEKITTDKYGRTWSLKEKEELKKLVKSKSLFEMAKQFGRSPNAVQKQLRTLGIKIKYTDNLTENNGPEDVIKF